MKGRGLRRLLAAAMVALFILHQDDWLASSRVRILGLPASLAWHIGLCLMATLVMALAVTYAWPEGLDDDAPHGRDS